MIRDSLGRPCTIVKSTRATDIFECRTSDGLFECDYHDLHGDPQEIKTAVEQVLRYEAILGLR